MIDRYCEQIEEGGLWLETNLADAFIIKTFCVAVAGEALEVVALFTVKDGVDGGLARNVLYLTAAEVVAIGKVVGIEYVYLTSTPII